MIEELIRLPAAIDPHVHFRTPGAEHKEDWISGARAAIRSGVTTVFDMPNNTPSCTTYKAFKEKCARIEQQLEQADIPLRYYLYFGADRDHLHEIPKVKDLAIGIKLFMGSSTGSLLIDDDPTLSELFHIAADQDMLISVHAEDEATIRKNKEIFSNSQDPADHSKIRSPRAAAIAVERAIDLAAKHGVRLCILHVSCKEELALIKQAKASGLDVFAEAAPHHLFLSVDDYGRWKTLVKVNPPLRRKEDQEALWAAIGEGTIDFIGTDHAPHTLEEKAQGSIRAPSGIPSIELLLPLLLDAVHRGRLPLEKMIQLTRTNIETIFRLPPNKDQVLVDLNRSFLVTDEGLKTKCGWSPYAGRLLQGCPVQTIVEGRVLCV